MAKPPDELVKIRTMPNEFQAGIVVTMLEDAGIPASTSAGDSYSLGVFGASGFTPTAVWVRRDDLDDAEEALANRREESIDLDWSEVNVGEPDPDDALAWRIAQGNRGASLLPVGGGATLILLAFAAMFALAALGLADWFVVAGVLALVIVISVVLSMRLRSKYDRLEAAEDAGV